MSKENKDKDFIKLPIELSEYQISFMPNFTGFYILKLIVAKLKFKQGGKFHLRII